MKKHVLGPKFAIPIMQFRRHLVRHTAGWKTRHLGLKKSFIRFSCTRALQSCGVKSCRYIKSMFFFFSSSCSCLLPDIPDPAFPLSAPTARFLIFSGCPAGKLIVFFFIGQDSDFPQFFEKGIFAKKWGYGKTQSRKMRQNLQEHDLLRTVQMNNIMVKNKKLKSKVIVSVDKYYSGSD